MSGGKSAVVAFGIEDHETDQLWAVEVELRGAKMRSDEYGDRIVPLVPESLLLDARAKFDASETISAAHEANWLEACAQRIDAEHRAERAEARAGEYERDARRYSVLRNGLSDFHGDCYAMTFDPEGDYPVVGADMDNRVDRMIERKKAIDAVGGRGEDPV